MTTPNRPRGYCNPNAKNTPWEFLLTHLEARGPGEVRSLRACPQVWVTLEAIAYLEGTSQREALERMLEDKLRAIIAQAENDKKDDAKGEGHERN